MVEQTYEGMFLLDSNKFAGNADNMTTEVLTIIERAGGKVLAHRPWQDGKLAYQMGTHKKGLYLLTYFTLDTQKLKEIDRLVGFNEAIIRHLVIKLDPALVAPMLAMATGKGELPSTFRDTDAEAMGMVGTGAGGGGRSPS